MAGQLNGEPRKCDGRGGSSSSRKTQNGRFLPYKRQTQKIAFNAEVAFSVEAALNVGIAFSVEAALNVAFAEPAASAQSVEAAVYANRTESCPRYRLRSLSIGAERFSRD